MDKEQQCLFCYKFSPVTRVEIPEERDKVIAIYDCAYDKCESLTRLGRVATLSIEHRSPRFVDSYERHNKSESSESLWQDGEDETRAES
jgi:hypothetical protein